MQNIDRLKKMLQNKADKTKEEQVKRYFKTKKGEYAEQDVFLGITVPEQRKIAKQFSDLALSDLTDLLQSKIHEERLTALLILVHQFKTGNENQQQKIFDLYLKNTAFINNWDLVDSSAEFIIGPWLENRDKSILLKLSQSKSLWERRVAMLSCFHYIKNHNAEWGLKIAEQLVEDKEDLIHKAVGWMLREIGKRCSQAEEEAFLEKYYSKMPRTMLRYAIERFDDEKRKFWLNRK